MKPDFLAGLQAVILNLERDVPASLSTLSVSLQSTRDSAFRCRTGHPEWSPFHSPLTRVFGPGGLHAGR